MKFKKLELTPTSLKRGTIYELEKSIRVGGNTSKYIVVAVDGGGVYLSDKDGLVTLWANMLDEGVCDLPPGIVELLKVHSKS